ncbi:MAG: Ig-like domain-containing protein [Phaeodactylibacter sp.]|nr:Ig-like domain-containing protein [Phaeodactylibacter sp.]
MRFTIALSAILLLFSGCIGDDVVFDTVPEAVRILNPVDSIMVGSTRQFEARFTNNIGEAEERVVFWSSSDAAVLGIDDAGLATALAAGKATVTAEVRLDGKGPVSDAVEVVVSEEEVSGDPAGERSGTIRTTSSYLLEGSFTLREDGEDIVLEFGSDYRASTSLPGLYVYLTNNPSTVNNAFEIGRVETFNGAHSYRISGVGLNDYSYLLYWCKPFSVKVGDGEIR